MLWEVKKLAQSHLDSKTCDLCDLDAVIFKANVVVSFNDHTYKYFVSHFLFSINGVFSYQDIVNCLRISNPFLWSRISAKQIIPRRS